jgi:hypothetical protein
MIIIIKWEICIANVYEWWKLLQEDCSLCRMKFISFYSMAAHHPLPRVLTTPVLTKDCKDCGLCEQRLMGNRVSWCQSVRSCLQSYTKHFYISCTWKTEYESTNYKGSSNMTWNFLHFSIYPLIVNQAQKKFCFTDDKCVHVGTK